MGKVQQFPVFRLPFLALKEAVKRMAIDDQFALSNVSKRSQLIVKCALRNQKYNVELEFDEDELTVIMHNSQKRQNLYLGNHDINGLDVIKHNIAILLNTFAVEKRSLYFHGIGCLLVLDIIPFLEQQNIIFHSLKAVNDDDEQNDKICELIFQECSTIKELEVAVPTTQPFRLCFGPFHCAKIILAYAPWFSIDHTTSGFMNCHEIILYECNFSCRDMNRFLRTWIAGSEIRKLSLNNTRKLGFKLKNALNGIPVTRVRRVKFTEDIGTQPSWVVDGFLVQQDGGLEVFVCQTSVWRVTMTNQFELNAEV